MASEKKTEIKKSATTGEARRIKSPAELKAERAAKRTKSKKKPVSLSKKPATESVAKPKSTTSTTKAVSPKSKTTTKPSPVKKMAEPKTQSKKPVVPKETHSPSFSNDRPLISTGIKSKPNRYLRIWEDLVYGCLKPAAKELKRFINDLGYDDIKSARIVYFIADSRTPSVIFFDSQNQALRKDMKGQAVDLVKFKSYKSYTLYSPNESAINSLFKLEDQFSLACVHYPSERGKDESVFLNALNKEDIEIVKGLGEQPTKTRSLEKEDVCIYGVAIDLQRSAVPDLVYKILERYALLFSAAMEKVVKNLEDADNFLPDNSDILLTVSSALMKNYCDIDLINILSGSKYENLDLQGGIIFAQSRNQVECSIVFSQPIDFSIKHLRQIRKVLQMTGNGSYMIVVKAKIIGIGATSLTLRTIKFAGHQKWILLRGEEELFRFWKGKYSIPSISRTYFVKPTFRNEADCKFANTHLITELRHEHGSLMIISDKENIIAEVNRLCSFERGYKINPIDLKVQDKQKVYINLPVLRHLASIDGAIFMDRDFVCYGVGIILDGVALNPGSSARGARYNSSKCYIENRKKIDGKDYTAVVVSEDESIDILEGYTITE